MPRRLTQKRALQVVLTHAARNVAGVGCGVRPAINREEQELVQRAIEVLWPKAHGYEMLHNDWFNLGFSGGPRGREPK